MMTASHEKASAVSKRAWQLLFLVLVTLAMPFLDISRIFAFRESDVIKTFEREGPFLVTNDVGDIVEVDERPELYNVTAPIHIIKSRFMQHQPDLYNLGWARYRLFKYLCFPSLVAQTSQNFVWLIYTDPLLSSDLEQAVISFIAPYPNFYLVKDNSEARFKGGVELERLDWEDVVSGDAQRLRYLLQQRDRYPILETRIDADDGLHKDFVAQIQKEAMRVLDAQSTHWTFWCISQAIEWHWVGECGVSDDQRRYGALLPSRRYDSYCHTPGMTLGLFRADESSDVMGVAHSRLWSTLEEKGSYCGPRTYGTDCIIHVDDFRFAALRARTPTSASMVGVNKQPIESLQEWDAVRDESWSYAIQNFAIDREAIKNTLTYLEKNMASILEDAEVGQCTEGHSCRKKAAKMIKELLKGNITCTSNQTDG